MNEKALELHDILAGDAFEERAARVESEHPADVAAAISELPPDRIWGVLKLASLEQRGKIFRYLSREDQFGLAMVAPRSALAAIVTEMRPDDRADLYKGLSEEQQEALMPALAQAEREDIRQLASYAEGTAGAIMTSGYATLAPDLTATTALTALRREAPDKETIYRTYVVDADRKLIGAVRLQDLITAPVRAKVRDIMQRNTHSISVSDDEVDAARKIAHYDMLALPVVDEENRIVGIITHDDALDVIEEEATDDFHRVGTVTNLDSSVADATIPMLYRARIAWLLLLVFGNIFSGAGLAHFEDTIAAHLALMFFLPVLIASGGNAGSQSATLMIRALATGDIRISDWGKLFGRELLVALLLGVSMSLAIALIGVVRSGWAIAAVVALAMILIVIVGSLIGLMLPFLLSRFGMDPATASTPLVTSIADVTGVIIYFSIARAFLPVPV